MPERHRSIPDRLLFGDRGPRAREDLKRKMIAIGIIGFVAFASIGAALAISSDPNTFYGLQKSLEPFRGSGSQPAPLYPPQFPP